MCDSIGDACLSRQLRRKAHVCVCVCVQHDAAPSQAVNLLRVAAEASIDLGVRQQGAIAFKNLVKKSWDVGGGCLPFGHSANLNNMPHCACKLSV